MFAIVRGPTRFWEKSTLKDIMRAYIIMHNIIIEDERDERERECRPRNTCEIRKLFDRVEDIPHIITSLDRIPTLMEFLENHHRGKLSIC